MHLILSPLLGRIEEKSKREKEMSEGITIEDIYKLFERSQAELAASRAEYDRRAAEADRRAAEADARIAKLEQAVAEATKVAKEANKAVSALTTRWGRFVEELVEPAVIDLFQQRGIDVKEIHPRMRTRKQGFAMEIDIFAVDDDVAVLVECKSRLSQDDVDEFMEKLKRFKLSFPHYSAYRVFGAVAGIEINEGIDRYAEKNGLFVIRPSGDSVTIVNAPDFVPSAW
jgi:hypothetical protein